MSDNSRSFQDRNRLSHSAAIRLIEQVIAVDFEEWEPIYERIVEEFSFDRAADERARDVLASLTQQFDLDLLDAVRGEYVIIAGDGPSLDSPESLETLRDATYIFAASNAATRLIDRNISISCMVTDVDSEEEFETIHRLTGSQTPVAIHSHGDNIEMLREVVPSCSLQFVLPTTQVRPSDHVHNFGGFTDGDRAAFLADSLGVSTLGFVGWDFDDSTVSTTKSRKLEWAQRLLYWLEIRRNQRFHILDGRRDRIDLSMFPPT